MDGCSGVVVEYRVRCCCRSLLITPLFNLSSCLFGSHRSPTVVPLTVLVMTTPLGELGVAGETTLGGISVEPGSGVSPSFCLTYVCMIGRESHLNIIRH